MFGRRWLLVSIALIALIGASAVVSLGGNSIGSNAAGETQFDLAAALDNAVSGDTVTLPGDTVLLRDAAVNEGVILDDGGFSLTIRAYTTLSVEAGGVFVSSGKLTIEYRGSLVASGDPDPDSSIPGGLVSIDNNGNTAEIAGSLEVYFGGTLNVGLNENSALDCYGTGNLFIEGTMNVGGGSPLASTVYVGNGTVTGKLEIADGSVFRVYDTLTIGSSPALTSDLDKDNSARTSVTGKVSLDGTACIIVYGKCGFDATNIDQSKGRSVSTQFIVDTHVYVTEYAVGKRFLVIPSASSFRDWRVVNWKDPSNNFVTDDSKMQIGSVGQITADMKKQTYFIVFAEDNSIRWIVSGISQGSSGQIDGAYGASYTISIRQAPGYTDLPSIFMNGSPFTVGANFTVSGDTTFTTSNNHPAKSGGVTTLEIVLCAMIVILVLILIALVIKTREKAKTK